MQRLLRSSKSEFLAITGRRRVGKTYLINQLYGPHYGFQLTGIQGGDLRTQLVNFGIKLSEQNPQLPPEAPADWQQAFLLLKEHLLHLPKEKKWVIFLDELPWIASARSGFLQHLGHFWNDFVSSRKNYILVICGSATSWIRQKIIDHPGGLHNRITEHLHLHPFTLGETKQFLASRHLALTDQMIAHLYMALGGIPYYLEQIRKGESFASTIERLLFHPAGILHREYRNLYEALFTNSALHRRIVETLAFIPYGATRKTIRQKAGIKPGGSFMRAMDELVTCDFVAEHRHFGRKKREAYFRLIDEYTLFYHRFVRPAGPYSPGVWQQISSSQKYKVWAGYAFEALCHKHVTAIKQALGISGVYTEVSSLHLPASKETPGAQVDMIIDRKDDSINLCEMKFHSAKIKIDKTQYEKLLSRKQRFVEHTGSKKQIFLTYVSNHGIVPNAYSNEIIDSEITLADIINT